MSEDIVYRLRNPNHWLFQIVGPKSGATVQGESDAPREAADEIERLRADLDAYQKERDEEVVRLRADCVKLETAHGQNMREIDRLRAELAAERDKLREQYEEAIAANIRLAYELAAERLKGQMQDRNNAERDALRALLREAREWIVEGKVDFNDALADRIDAALEG